jgi:deoxyhypusine synthase
MKRGPVSQFIELHDLHFNAAAWKDAAEAYTKHLDAGGIMLLFA